MNAQPATLDVVRSPTPRIPNRGCHRNPVRHNATTSTSACATMLSVALPANSHTMDAVHWPGLVCPS